ncbi:MAG: hypothetical protein GOU98_01815 [Candidatus Altiarchaeota archaeon]|nr:hypothetical protein [Candidatus Altiarchaeota archaeon]
MEELEGKLVGVNVENLMAKLMTLEIPVTEILQEDTIFNKNGCTYRVRNEEGAFILTYKGKLIKKGNLKSRNEIEFLISDPKAVVEFFSVIGVDTSSPKTRTKKLLRFNINGTKGELVFIDTLPPTLELEGDEDNIRSACDTLNLDFSKLQPISWSEVLPI